MPLYEYECERNGHRFELIRKFSDPPVTRCIKCKSKVQRLLSAPAISFKGSGWYVNDYGKGNGAGAKAADGKDSKSGSDSKSGDSSKKDSAPSGGGKSDKVS